MDLGLNKADEQGAGHGYLQAGAEWSNLTGARAKAELAASLGLGISTYADAWLSQSGEYGAGGGLRWSW